MLQTGTFLQTILLLAAIASRLNALSIGLHSVVETVGKSIHALVAVTVRVYRRSMFYCLADLLLGYEVDD